MIPPRMKRSNWLGVEVNGGQLSGSAERAMKELWRRRKMKAKTKARGKRDNLIETGGGKAIREISEKNISQFLT